MTSYVAGTSAALTAEWRAYAGGPMSAMTGVTIGITNVSTAAVALAPTATGVATPSTGINTYSWAIGSGLAAGDYLVTWTGIDPQSDVVSATEVVTVLAAASTAYTSLASVKSSLGKLTADDRDSLILQAIAAASRLIDQRTGRYFYADTTATARTFVVGRRTTLVDLDQVVMVDDISTASGLAVAVGDTGSYGTSTGWEPGPDNALVYGQPFTQLRARVGWLPPYTRVQVTARWGWPAVPDQIAQAAQLLAARLYRRKDSPQGVIGSADWGVMRVSRIDPDVEALIAPFVIPVIA